MGLFAARVSCLMPCLSPSRSTAQIGFNVVVGGFFSVKRAAESIPLDMWIKQSDTLNFCEGL